MGCAAPEGTDVEFTFENVHANCPQCGHRNTFNRRSDLHTLDSIDSLQVVCESPGCSKPFHIKGDLASPAYQAIILDCVDLLDRKQYSYCVLNLTQAFEAFFYHSLRVDLIYKPFWSDVRADRDVNSLRTLEKILGERTKRFAFQDMKNLFISYVLYEAQPKSLAESQAVIMRIPLKPASPSNDDIRTATTLKGEQIRELLLRLNAFKVHELRNRIIHGRTYRPSADEARRAYKQTREILFPLGRLLEVSSANPNSYHKQRV